MHIDFSLQLSYKLVTHAAVKIMKSIDYTLSVFFIVSLLLCQNIPSQSGYTSCAHECGVCLCDCGLETAADRETVMK